MAGSPSSPAEGPASVAAPHSYWPSTAPTSCWRAAARGRWRRRPGGAWQWGGAPRSGEGRVGEEGRFPGAADHLKKKKIMMVVFVISEILKVNCKADIATNRLWLCNVKNIIFCPLHINVLALMSSCGVTSAAQITTM